MRLGSLSCNLFTLEIFEDYQYVFMETILEDRFYKLAKLHCE